MEENPVICDCNDICKSSIVTEITDKQLKTVYQVGQAIKAGTGCGGCQTDIQGILNELNNLHKE